MADVDPALGHRDRQSTASVTQVGRDHNRRVRLDGVLGKHVHPGHAELTPAFLHLDHDVGRPHEHNVEPRMSDDRRLVLTITRPPDLVAGRLQELDNPIVKVPLGRDRQPDGIDHSRHHEPIFFRCVLTLKANPGIRDVSHGNT